MYFSYPMLLQTVELFCGSDLFNIRYMTACGFLGLTEGLTFKQLLRFLGMQSGVR